MKKQISIFFLLVLFLPSVGTSLWFMHRQEQIRKEVKHKLIAGLDDSELTHFTFTEKELATLEWKDDMEFRLNGYMYDIVNREKVGDTYHFWCWKDDKETSLYQEFESLLAKMNPPVQEDQQNTLKWRHFQNTLYCSSFMGWKPTIFLSKEALVVIPYSNLYCSVILESLSPPPLAG